jgi:hypothetical protein
MICLAFVLVGPQRDGKVRHAAALSFQEQQHPDPCPDFGLSAGFAAAPVFDAAWPAWSCGAESDAAAWSWVPADPQHPV